MKAQNTGVLIGSAVGAMLTAALIAVFYAGWRLADLPFVPFDVFDWMTRVLPGAVIEFVISAMVAAIRGLHLGPTSVVAKIIEQAIGIVQLCSHRRCCRRCLFQRVCGHLADDSPTVSGFFLGLITAVPAVLISSFLNKTAVAPPSRGALDPVRLCLLGTVVRLGLSDG